MSNTSSMYESFENEHESSGEEKVTVKRGRIVEFTTYEVADHELLLIEKGTDASLFLNFGISLLSVFFSLLAALLTLDYKKQTEFFILTIIAVISFISGLICMVLWWKNRNKRRDIIKEIRKRIR